MLIRIGMYGPDVVLHLANKHGKERVFPISTDKGDGTINVPATGDITASSARLLAQAFLLAADLAEGIVEVG